MMINLFLKAKNAHINIDTIPICIYTSGIHADFAKFLGWGAPNITNFSTLSVTQIEPYVRKWVESPT